MALKMWEGQPGAEEAWLIRSSEEQAADLLEALRRWDAQQDGNGHAAPTPPRAPVPQPTARAMAPAAMAPMPQASPDAPPVPRTPVTAAPAAKPRQPEAQPVAGAANQVVGALKALSSSIDELTEKVNDEVAGHEDLMDLKEIVLGMARTQQTIAVLALLTYEKVMEEHDLNRRAVINLIKSELKEGTPKSLMKAHAGVEEDEDMDDDEGKD